MLVLHPAMSPAKARRRKSRKRTGNSILRWWPLALALVATPFAVRAASVLALSGPGALRLLYPSLALLQAHAGTSLAPARRDTLATILLWTQFPIYGLIAVLFNRWRGIAVALLAVLLLHAILCLAAVLAI